MQNNKSNKSIFEKVPIAKAVDEELKQATFIVMVPDLVDAHGDVTSIEDIRKACYNFNKSAQQANLFHLTKTDTFEFAESYIAPVDMLVGDKLVLKGSWLTTIQCLDDQVWDAIKSGSICGVSVGCLASVEEIKENDGD